MERTYTAKEIAEIMGKSKRAIQKRAKKEGWPSVNGNGKGGRHLKYPLPDCPPDVQLAIYNKDGAPPELLPMLSPAVALLAMGRQVSAPTFTENLQPSKSRRTSIPGAPSPRENLPAVSPLYFNDTSAAGINLGDTIASCPPNSREFLPARTYEYEKLPAWSPERAISLGALKNDRIRTILAILREADAMPRDWTKGSDAWIKFVAAKNKIGRQTIYRWLKKHDQRGIAGLEHRKSSRGKAKAWTPEALDFWVGLCLKPEHRKIGIKSLYYDALVLEAHRRDWRIGCLESANWWYNKKATPLLLAMQKGGMRAVDNLLPPVLRNYADLAPFEMLVGDQHRFDFWVVDDDTGVVFRPEGYLWQDLRTRIIYGAAFDRRYDAHLCGLALRIGIGIWGCFNAIYTDNGSSELSKYIMGILSEIRSLGMEWKQTLETPMDILDADGEDLNPVVESIAPGTHKKAVVKNAKAKLIEKSFDVVEGILRSRFRLPGSVKRLSDDIHHQDVDHHEARQLAVDGKLLLASEFYLTIYKAIDYYNRERAHRGVRREWVWKPVPVEAAPMDCLKLCYADGWRPRRISGEAADMIFLRRVSRVVRMGRVELDRELYEHDALLDLHGERVELRYNPIERDLVLIYRGGQFYCAANPVEYSSMKDADLAERKILEKREKRQAVAEQFRTLTKQIPDLREYSQVPQAEKVAAIVGQERKRIEAAQANAVRVMSPEELAMKVAELEALNERLPDGRTRAMAMAQMGKSVPPRPGYFATATDRYFWCIKCEASGCELSAEDRYFVEEEELKMMPAERERWQFEREYGTGT